MATLTLQVQALPNADQAKQFRATVQRFNAAANWLAGHAFALRNANKVELQRLYYRELREQFGLSAQMAVRCIARTCEAYSRDKTIRPTFRSDAAMPFDQRMMSFKGEKGVSVLTLDGRVIVPIIMGRRQRERFTAAAGQTDLVCRRDGKWFLLVSTDVLDGPPIATTDFIGVDLGLVNLATDSDGTTHTGAAVEKVRRRHQRNRNSLQQTGTRGARKRLKMLSGRESRFRRHENHRISKQIVQTAQGTQRGIALEDLTHIRSRTTVRRKQRARHAAWAFRQLRTFVQYKAAIAGVPVVLVDPRNTSRTCSECGHCEAANRKGQDFRCLQCSYSTNADFNAARNLSGLGRLVNAPQTCRLAHAS
jgi:putative transposase